MFSVPSLSRLYIRSVAQHVRKINAKVTGSDPPRFPIVEFIDITLPKQFPYFTLEIVTEENLGIQHGMSYPDDHLIQIREDIYWRACQNLGRDRMTLAHELGHYVLHADLGPDRNELAEATPIYRQSEWQADAFGGELLISVDHINLCRTPEETAELFGVSLDAAKCQWNVYQKEGLIGQR